MIIGPAGEFRNAQRMCRRVVLDTNCVVGTPRHVLAALRDRGWLLSVSSVALDERAARAASGMPSDRFFALLRSVNPYLDPELPIAIAGWEGLPAIGGAWRGRRQEGRDELAATSRDIWQALRNEQLDLSRFAVVADETKKDIDELGAAWVKQHTGARALAQHALTPEQEVQQVASLARHIAGIIEGVIRVPGGVFQRLNAWCHYFAVSAVIATRGSKRGSETPSPKQNDADDMHLLTHLYGSCFLMTSNYKLIAKVDESRTFQARWVRTPGELLTDEMPPGVPWTKTARAAAHLFARRLDLRAHDLEMAEFARTGMP